MELSQVEELAVLLREQPISEIEISRHGSRVHLRKGAAAVSAAAPTGVMAAEPAAAVREEASPSASVDTTILLSSEIVGLFHHAEPPIRVGSIVKAGQVVGNIEAMKLMNEVVADAGGQVVEVLIEDGEPVDYGRLLFRMGPV